MCCWIQNWQRTCQKKKILAVIIDNSLVINKSQNSIMKKGTENKTEDIILLLHVTLV